MSRTDFIISQGATCRNWTWSWSFIDDIGKRVIFGAWEDLVSEDGTRALILSNDWKENEEGETKLGYIQAREHLDKIMLEGYQLYTFSQKRSKASNEKQKAKIKSFVPDLQLKYLVHENGCWYATNEEEYDYSPEVKEEHYEGDKKVRLSTYYEKNPKARKECLEHYGYSCKACGFNFEDTYGEIGKNFIHVHHINPVATIGKRYKIDPKNHLIPLCANCHAMIHIGSDALTVDELKRKLKKQKNKR